MNCKRHLPAIFAISFLVSACSPLCRLELHFAFKGAPLDPALFQLTGRKACPPGPVAAPIPLTRAALARAAAGSNDAAWQEVRVEPPGLHVVAGFRGSRCRVRVTAHYDSNGDGIVNSGDLVASSGDIDLADNGVFRGNLTLGPTLRFSAIP